MTPFYDHCLKATATLRRQYLGLNIKQRSGSIITEQDSYIDDLMISGLYTENPIFILNNQ